MSSQLEPEVIHQAQTVNGNHSLPAQPETAVRRAIVQNRLELWTNTLYAAQVQARVARALDNPKLLAEAQHDAEQAIRALDELAAILRELDA